MDFNFFTKYVYVPCGCCKKLPQTCDLTEVHFPQFWRPEDQKQHHGAETEVSA